MVGHVFYWYFTKYLGTSSISETTWWVCRFAERFIQSLSHSLHWQDVSTARFKTKLIRVVLWSEIRNHRLFPPLLGASCTLSVWRAVTPTPTYTTQLSVPANRLCFQRNLIMSQPIRGWKICSSLTVHGSIILWHCTYSVDVSSPEHLNASFIGVSVKVLIAESLSIWWLKRKLHTTHSLKDTKFRS